MSMSPYQDDGAGLPAEFVAKVVELHRNFDPRLPAVFQAARDAGWKLTVLGHAIGVTNSWAGQIAAKAEPGDVADIGMPIPTPPAKPAPKRWPKAVALTDTEAETLRALNQAWRVYLRPPLRDREHWAASNELVRDSG
ncbi:hypothetical protein ABZ682_19475 [Streptomyces griseoviridis]|uniref:hypothetical protein n=1 Tax=Streptomyces griseoviridis TaxID=45398 RepID=UPI0033F4AE61